VVIGTHALIEPKVFFKDLQMAVVDEQHRFGVEQRKLLFLKAKNPHLLQMTATPIPQSMALALYGDMELSELRELPPGRQPTRTRVVKNEQLPKVFDFLREQLSLGHQIYIVYPRIDEEGAAMGFRELSPTFAPHRSALLHGRLTPTDKSKILNEFTEGKIKVLFSTSVVEVGIDVPNATSMLVFSAERFGLAQLHQLRGRVSRSQHRSGVFVMQTETPSPRLQFLETNQNGFDIAEFDLQQRGSGELLGQRQAGDPNWLMADFFRDSDLHKIMFDYCRSTLLNTP
jgi:ATP-dependent DNA helicase RecG